MTNEKNERNYLIRCTPEEMNAILEMASFANFDLEQGNDTWTSYFVKHKWECVEKIVNQITAQNDAAMIYDKIKTPGKWFIRDAGFIEFRPDGFPEIINYRFKNKQNGLTWFVTQEKADGETEIFPDVEFDCLIDELNNPTIHA